MKEIQDLVVKDSEKYVVEPLDPNLFAWDDKYVFQFPLEYDIADSNV